MIVAFIAQAGDADGPAAPAGARGPPQSTTAVEKTTTATASGKLFTAASLIHGNCALTTRCARPSRQPARESYAREASGVKYPPREGGCMTAGVALVAILGVALFAAWNLL